MKLTDNSFLMKTEDGRTWRVEVFGPGQKVKVTDIMSPTGYYEWVMPEAAGIRFLRAPGE